jgi:hypothetical protein
MTPAGGVARLPSMPRLLAALLALLFALPAAAAEALAPLELREVDESYARWLAEHPPAAQPYADGYHRLEEIHAQLGAQVQRRPHMVRPFMAGRTVKSRPIWGYRIADPAHPITHRVLVFGGIHAIEWIASEAVLAYALEFIDQPVEGVELVVIPVLNIDGRRRVERDLEAGENIFRRANHNGIDLNRDFAIHHESTSLWRHLLPGYHAASPAPLSQPESQAIDRLAGLGHFDLAVSLHSFGGFHYLPWSGRWERPEDQAALRSLGYAMASGMGAHAYRVLQLSRWGFFFRAQGSEIDHLYGAHGIPAVLIECGRTGLSPFRPGEWRSYFWRYNPHRREHHTGQLVGALRAGVLHVSGHYPGPFEP